MPTGEPVGAGSRFVAEPKGMGARGQMGLETVEYRRPHRLHKVIRSSYMHAAGTLTFAEAEAEGEGEGEGEGGTRLRWDWTMRLAGPTRVLTTLLMLVGPLWERRNWVDLKDQLEQRFTAPGA